MDERTLNTVVRGPEGERVERKERLTASKDDVCKAICAFANDLPRSGEPGVVIIGQTDKGKPIGLPITDGLLRELADLRTNGGKTWLRTAFRRWHPDREGPAQAER